MKEQEVGVGVYITCLTVHDLIVSGHIEAIFNKTLVIRDSRHVAHVVRKSELEKQGYSIGEYQTALHGNRHPGTSKN